MTIELRCDNKKFGEVYDDFIEVKCSSRFCGAGSGIVVIHRFDRETGKLLETLRFRELSREKH